MHKLNILFYYSNISVMLGTGEEAQQPDQEQSQADEVLTANCEQLQLTIKEIEREIESFGNTFTFESSTLKARGKLAKIQVHYKSLKRCT